MKYLNYLGAILVVLGVVFFTLRVATYFDMLKGRDIFSAGLIGCLFFLSLAYAAVNVIFTQAWRNILISEGVTITPSLAIKIFGQSQIAKYIPGNIFHLAGRQIISMNYNLPAKNIGRSIIIELACQVLVGITFVIWCLQYRYNFISVKYIAIGIFLAFLAFLFVTQYLGKRKLFLAVAQQFTGLLFTGVIFWGLFVFFQNANYSPSINEVFFIASNYVAAWLIGLVTPGAPAGFGIRETILTYALKSYSTDVVLLSTMFSRMVTVFGDLLLYIATFFIRKNNV